MEFESGRMTARGRHLNDLLQELAGYSSAISVHGGMLSGARPISRVTLILAEAEGRNYLQELQAKYDHNVIERVRVADLLIAEGVRVRRYDEYRAALDEVLNRRAVAMGVAA